MKKKLTGKEVVISDEDMVCVDCGKSYEEWVGPNYCRGCRTCDYSVKRKDYKTNTNKH